MNPAALVACGLIAFVTMSTQAAPVDNSEHLLEKKDELTRLVLINAIYFKGEWKNPFDPKDTSNAPFHLTGGGTVNSPMMSRKGEYKVATDEKLGCRVLKMPYQGEELTMLIILPDKNDGLAQVEGAIASMGFSQTFLAWRNNFVLENLNVDLPKFKMGDMFDQSGAALSRDVSEVMHKAFVEVNEEGTEAAAATAAQFQLRSRIMNPTDFIADHPFLFLIRDNKSGSVLFFGRMVDPTGGE